MRGLCCELCGHRLRFDPARAGLACDACGNHQAVVRAESPAAHPYETNARRAAQAFGPAAKEVECTSCGARVEFTPPLVCSTCSFCASPIHAQPHTPDPLLTPDAVVPFSISAADAIARFRRWTTFDSFAPAELRQLARVESLRPVYLPFWLFRSRTDVRWTGKAQDTQQRSGSGKEMLWDLAVPAAHTIPAERLRTLAPWEWDTRVAYDPAFLAGIEALRYEADLPAAWENAQAEMRKRFDQAIRQRESGIEQIDHIELRHDDVQFEHVLAPVWIGAYRFRGKAYQVLVHGRTGVVDGEHPQSPWKLAVFFGLLILIAGLVILIAVRLIW